MFFISLPCFYPNYKFNNFFKKYIINNPDKIITEFRIEYFYGSMPWSYWNGHINNHTGKAALYPEMSYLFRMAEAGVRIDWSNCFLTENDFNDVHENATLKLLAESSNVCEISDLKLLTYIANVDINMKFIISNNSQILHPFSNDLINLLADQEYIELITVNNIQDFDLNNLPKKKIEIPIGGCTKCDLNQQLHCSRLEQASIYSFSNNSSIQNCNSSAPISNYYEAIKPYLNQGFTHFKITTNTSDLNNFNMIIINSFIKPEYIGECINEYYKSLNE